jgi:hypothetical protein
MRRTPRTAPRPPPVRASSLERSAASRPRAARLGGREDAPERTALTRVLVVPRRLAGASSGPTRTPSEAPTEAQKLVCAGRTVVIARRVPDAASTSAAASGGWAALNGLSAGSLGVAREAMRLGAGMLVLLVLAWLWTLATLGGCPEGDSYVLVAGDTRTLDPGFSTRWRASFGSNVSRECVPRCVPPTHRIRVGVRSRPRATRRGVARFPHQPGRRHARPACVQADVQRRRRALPPPPRRVHHLRLPRWCAPRPPTVGRCLHVSLAARHGGESAWEDTGRTADAYACRCEGWRG